MNFFKVLALLVFITTSGYSQSLNDCKRCIILSEQSAQRVAIADADKNAVIWEWTAAGSNVKPEHVKWFTNISEAKPVYNLDYILATASGGGVALIRIADKKTIFYAYAGGNTHSAEILPDGNIVTASSTGNFLTLFNVDTLNFPEKVYSKNIPAAFAHNVVWDRKNGVLWTAVMDKMKIFEYNFDCTNPDLILRDSIGLPGTEAHDLFPVYKKNALWLSNTSAVYQFDVAKRKLTKTGFSRPHIKSISSGPANLPVIMIKPTEKWWTDKVTDSEGNTIFQQNGLKIYKARWLVTNTFSYPSRSALNVCK